MLCSIKLVTPRSPSKAENTDLYFSNKVLTLCCSSLSSIERLIDVIFSPTEPVSAVWDLTAATTCSCAQGTSCNSDGKLTTSIGDTTPRNNQLRKCAALVFINALFSSHCLHHLKLFPHFLPFVILNQHLSQSTLMFFSFVQMELDRSADPPPAIWVSTTKSSVNKWSLKGMHNFRSSGEYDNDCTTPLTPLCTQPEQVIKGGASIIQCHILNDKRHILTKDTNNNVAYWDVLKACKGEDLGKVEFDEEIKKRFKMVYVPNWFSVDLKTGMLTITLDESDCFAAWVSAKDAGFSSSDGSDPKLNLGGLLLQALLEFWPRTRINPMDEEENEVNHVNGEQENRVQKGNGYFQVPPHTPVIFGEAGGRTLFRLLCRDSGGETESMLLNETVPQWVIDITVDKNMPKFNKIPFYLQPHSSSGAKTLKKDRLSASDMLQVRKVMEHVYEKIINLDNESQTTSSSANDKPGEQEKEEDMAMLAEEKIELMCQDQVLDPNMDLRTVKHFIWKSGGDLTLHYRQKST
uniref:WD repeat-containing protein 48 n=1 Tax=Xiphophorus couchianus TaxID=32473 RepID=A0A3B5LXM4_9TELE